VLEAVRTQPSVRAAVMITSDKCYENLELARGYGETDRLGGADPYSASKACAEIAISSYARSFLLREGRRVASTRAGNVIGGGDWAKDRIVPDCVRAWTKGEATPIRNPAATRPWQHVLEPLSGYLWLGACLAQERAGTNGEAFNFGPAEGSNHTVAELADALVRHWPGARWTSAAADAAKPEAGLLQLDCAKARKALGWQAVLDFEETAAYTADWYRAQHDGQEADAATRGQIERYAARAREKDAPWAK
jgi:CDP-glucose 4,6-dehydratase